MKNDAPQDTDLHKLGEIIDDIDIAMLTTKAADGSLVSRPLHTLKLDSRGDIIFFTAAKSHKVEELTDDHGVNLAYADKGESIYVSIRGRARLDRDQEIINELWSPAHKIFFPDGKDDPNLMVLRVRVRDASYWEGSGNFIERAFDFARAMIDDKPGDLGEHGHLEG
jgi:general stress protein 26